MSSFNITLSPLPQESLPGYLTRVSEANGYRSIHKITEFLGLLAYSNGDLTNLTSIASGLAKLCGITHDEIQTMGYQPYGAFSNTAEAFNGQKLPRSLINIEDQCICPTCLVEGKGHKHIFDLCIVTHCPEHGCELIHECPSCNKPLDWNRRSLSICGCGYNLSNAPIQMSDNLVSKIISNICYPTLSAGSYIGKYIKLTSLPLITFGKIIFFLAWCMGDATRQQYLKNKRFSPVHALKIVKHITPLLESWPNNWIKHLGKAQNNLMGFQALRNIQTELNNINNEDVLQVLRDAYEQHFQTTSINSASQDGTNSIGDYLTITDTMKFVDTSRANIDWLIMKNDIKEHTIVNGNLGITGILKSDAAKLKSYFDGLTNLTKFSKSNGMTKKACLKLVEKHNISPVRGPDIDGHGWSIYHISELEKCITNLSTQLDLPLAA